jgi:hypothetical protein
MQEIDKLKNENDFAGPNQNTNAGGQMEIQNLHDILKGHTPKIMIDNCEKLTTLGSRKGGNPQ